MISSRAIISLLTLLLCAAPASGAQQCANHDAGKVLQVRMTLPVSRLQLGNTLPVNLTVQNVGVKSVVLPKLMLPEDYWLRFEVRDVAGKLVPYSGPEYKAGPEAEQTVDLLPSYSYGRQVSDLAALYHVTKLGRYSVQAVYGRAPDVTCPLSLYRSNIVQVTVHRGSK